MEAIGCRLMQIVSRTPTTGTVPGGFTWSVCFGDWRLQNTGEAASASSSAIGPSKCPRESHHFPYIMHAGQIRDQPVDSDAIAAVRHRPVAA